MDFLVSLAEERIREAMEKGEFENLPGKGKPLKIENLSQLPEDLRAGYMLLKNAGMIPPEMEQKKELVDLQSLIDCCKDEGQKAKLKKTLNEKLLRFNLMMERRGRSSCAAFEAYEEKILEKLKL